MNNKFFNCDDIIEKNYNFENENKELFLETNLEVKEEFEDIVEKYEDDIVSLNKKINNLQRDLEEIRYLKNKNLDLESEVESLRKNNEYKLKEKNLEIIALQEDEKNELREKLKNKDIELKRIKEKNVKLESLYSSKEEKFLKSEEEYKKIITEIKKYKGEENSALLQKIEKLKEEKEILINEKEDIQKRLEIKGDELMIKPQIIDSIYREIDFIFSQILFENMEDFQALKEKMNEVVKRILNLRRYWAGVDLEIEQKNEKVRLLNLIIEFKNFVTEKEVKKIDEIIILIEKL